MTTEVIYPSVDMLVEDWSPGARTPAKNGLKKKPATFLSSQRERLLQLREALANSVANVAQVSRENVPECSSSGQHPADGGSDSYDRDFALSLLSHEQNVLFEIDQALQRIVQGTYGICELSGEAISRSRLEALPFARLTVREQAERERANRSGRCLRSTGTREI